ncbi:MAG: hypothetical protein CMF55_00660 [Legionellales bacterium]|nr:hypothetical protein [Legionellales bacterium]|tara:strand:- start:98 stop:313 length:216 start_codon:yes stop_codon:yes gene_type:complete
MGLEGSNLEGFLYSVVGIFLLLLYGKVSLEIMIYFDDKSNNNEKVVQEKSTLAPQDDSFINGMIWADVGRE